MKNNAIFCCFGGDLLAEFNSGAMVTKGVLAVLFGLLFMLSPSLLPWTLGVLLVMNGAFALAAAFSVTQGRWYLVFYSIWALLMGIFIMAEPMFFVYTAIWILGIWLLVSAAVQIIKLLFERDNSVPIFMQLISALFSGLLGLLFFIHPFVSALAVTAFAGAALIVWGMFFVIFGIVVKAKGRSAAAEVSGDGSDEAKQS